MNKKISIDKVLGQFRASHGLRYGYDLIDYRGTKVKIKIVCSVHGIFEQEPHIHKNGHGCPECANTKMAKNMTHNVSEILKKFDTVHGKKYDYKLINYQGDDKKIQIVCKLHGVFEQEPRNHKQGHGCPKCSEWGFKDNKCGVLYYVKFIEHDLYKIGITNRTIKKRFGKDFKKLVVIKEIPFKSGGKCRKVEQLLLARHSHKKYNGKPLLEHGNTEIFRGNVLGW